MALAIARLSNIQAWGHVNRRPIQVPSNAAKALRETPCRSTKAATWCVFDARMHSGTVHGDHCALAVK